nr:hypothetical protein [Tanacetum cinerariifolium]
PDSPLHLPNEEPVLGYLKFSAKGTKRGVFGMPIPGLACTKAHQARKGAQDNSPKAPLRPSVSILVTSAQPAPTSVPAKLQEKKRKQATEISDKPLKAKKSKYGLVSKKRTLKGKHERGLLSSVVIKEPESGKYQPLPEVPGKGKAKVTEEQVAHDLLSLQKPKKKSLAYQYIFQRHVKECSKKDKIGSKPDKNGKRGEAGKI